MMTYKKGADPEIDREFTSGSWFENIRLGKRHIFVKQFLRTQYISAEEVERAWRRVEQVEARTGCCSNDFSKHFLVLSLKNGEELTLKIGEALYRHEPEALMEELAKRWPEIRIGKA